LANIPLGNHTLTVKHVGNVATTVTHLARAVNLSWEARFVGVFDSLLVNNVKVVSQKKTINGTEISYVTIAVEPGKSAVVTTGQKLPPEKISIPLANKGFESGTQGWTFSGNAGASAGLSHGGSQRAWLDPGITNKVSQTVVIPGNGKFTGSLTAWVAASGLQGKLGARVKGGAEKTVLIPQKEIYNQIAIDSISLMGGDSIELYVTGSSTGWVNVDDFVFVIQKQDDVVKVRSELLPENIDCRVSLARGRIIIDPLSKQTSLKVEMFGLDGQKVLSHEASGQSPFEIDISALAKGRYILRIQGLDSVFSRSVTLY